MNTSSRHLDSENHAAFRCDTTDTAGRMGAAAEFSNYPPHAEKELTVILRDTSQLNDPRIERVCRRLKLAVLSLPMHENLFRANGRCICQPSADIFSQQGSQRSSEAVMQPTASGERVAV